MKKNKSIYSVFSSFTELWSKRCLSSMKNNKANEIPRANVLPPQCWETIGSSGACGEVWQACHSEREPCSTPAM